jgi:hypothetical protein
VVVACGESKKRLLRIDVKPVSHPQQMCGVGGATESASGQHCETSCSVTLAQSEVQKQLSWLLPAVQSCGC